MSSEEKDYCEYSEEMEENDPDNEQTNEEGTNAKQDDLSSSTDVNLETKCDDDQIGETEAKSPSHEQRGKIEDQELPQSGNTHGFKTQFESAPTLEEKRAARRRERRRQRKLTDEEDGPTEGCAQSTVKKFENGDIDDMHYQKTDTSQDSMASSGTVSATTAMFKSGRVSPPADDGDSDSKKEEKAADDKDVVEVGTAALRRKELEEHVEEAKKSKIAGSTKTLDEEGVVLSPGSAESTKAKLQRISSEENVFEKDVDDTNTPKEGTASEKRANFEAKARKSASLDDDLMPRLQRRSKWPEPKTNYRGQRGVKKSASLDADDDAITMVEKENAKNIEKSKEADSKENGNEEPHENSRSLKTAAIRNKLVRMLSEEKPPSHSIDRIGTARPSSGTARNLRARFEEGQVQQEASHFTGKMPSISSRSGYASKVKERFESGEVGKRRTSSSSIAEEEGVSSVDGETATTTRRRRTSSSRSIDGESVTMRRSAKELRSRFENPSQNTNQVKKNFVLRHKPTASICSKFNKSAPAINKCTKCTKTVYPMEMITADDKPFHRFCFKCTECKATLRLGNYAALQGQIYCKPHFKQLFKVKGNYDEGFGRQQHKKNWDEKAKIGEIGEEEKVTGDNDDDDNENDTPSNLESPVDNEANNDLINGYDDDNVTANQANGHVLLNHEDSFGEGEA